MQRGLREEVVDSILRRCELERHMFPTDDAPRTASSTHQNEISDSRTVHGSRAHGDGYAASAEPVDERFHRKRLALRIPLQLQSSQRLRTEVEAFIGNKLVESPNDPEDAFTLSFLFKHRAGDRASVQLLLSWLQARLNQEMLRSADLASPLEAAYKCALFLAHELSVGCYERGALFAQIWNFYTATLDAELLRCRSSLSSTSALVESLEAKTHRLESKMDWVHEAREDVETLRAENGRLHNALFLAETERDFLLRRSNDDRTEKAQERQRRAQEHWDRARRLTQTNELVNQLKKDVKQLAACANFAEQTAKHLAQELLLSVTLPHDSVEKLQRGLDDISQVCGNAVEVHQTFQNRAMHHSDLAEGFFKKFANRSEEKLGIFEALIRGRECGDVGLERRIETYLSPQENEIAAEIRAACANAASISEKRTEMPVTTSKEYPPERAEDPTDPSAEAPLQARVEVNRARRGDAGWDDRADPEARSRSPSEGVSENLSCDALPKCSAQDSLNRACPTQEKPNQPLETKANAPTVDVGIQSEAVRERDWEERLDRCDELEKQIEALKSQLALCELSDAPSTDYSTPPRLKPATEDRECQTDLADMSLSPFASPRSNPSRKPKPARTLQGAGRCSTVKKRSGDVERRLSFDSDGDPTEAPEKTDPQKREPFADGLLIPTDLRLLDVVKKHSNARVRSKEWLLKFIDELYRAKRQNDEQRVQSGLRVQSLAEFMFKHLNGFYGTKTLVNEYSASVVATVNKFHRHDIRVEIFGHFLSEYWDAATLTVFLRGFEKLLEPSRVPCLEFPTDYHKHVFSQSAIQQSTCCDIAESILGPNTADVREAFRRGLLEKSSAVTEEETISRFYSAPGMDFKEALALKSAAVANGACSVLPDIVFLALLCKEHIRCERVFLDALPRIFKDTDTNHDGTLSKEEISQMLRRLFDAATTPSVELGASVEEFWEDCVFAQRLQSKGVPWRRKKEISDDETDPSEESIGLHAFSEAAAKSAILRSYVRQHCTPVPSKAATAADAENASLYLLAVVDRHWKFNHGALMKCIGLTGNRESILRELVSKLGLEIQGARKADLYHNILRLLCEQFLHQLQEREPSLQLVRRVGEVSVATGLSESGVRDGVADLDALLSRAVGAIKVMYGTRYLVEENVVTDNSASSVADRALQQRRVRDAIAVHNGLRLQIQSCALHVLSRQLPVCLARWRQRTFSASTP